MHPYSRASIASALNGRTLSLHGALGRSKSSRENLLIHAHAALLRWLISCVSSPSSLTRPPKYRNWVVWAYFCPAASMTSRGGGDPPFFGCSSVRKGKKVESLGKSLGNRNLRDNLLVWKELLVEQYSPNSMCCSFTGTVWPCK